MLAQMISERMREKELSLRGAATQIGIAHTTLKRAVDGQSLDLDTVRLISDWLGVPVSDVVDLHDETVDEFPRRFAVFVAQYPELKEVMDDALKAYSHGDIEASVVKDIANYIAFRLEQASS